MATLTATPEPGNVPPRVAVEGAGFTGASSVTVLRRDPDGRSRPVRSGEPAALSGGDLATVYDYESPFGQQVSYTAVPDTGASADSAWVVLVVSDVWLRHPGVPALSVPVTAKLRAGSFGQATRAIDQSVHYPVGRAAPVTVNAGQRRAVTSSMRVRTVSLVEAGALVALMDDGVPLLLTVPVSRQWGITNEFCALGDVVQSRRDTTVTDPTRYFDIPFTVVDRPVGSLAAQWTWSDVVADYSTWASVIDVFPTWADLLADRPTVETPPTPDEFDDVFDDVF